MAKQMTTLERWMDEVLPALRAAYEAGLVSCAPVHSELEPVLVLDEELEARLQSVAPTPMRIALPLRLDTRVTA